MKKYWKSLEERENLSVDRSEIQEHKHKNAVIDLLDSKTVDQPASRRDFLKLWGYSLGAAALAASCERPVQKAIPFLFRPEEVTPGMARYYASTYFDGQEYASILVKTRDGRPIKIEPNDRSGFGARGTTARVQASVLSLYDDSRYKHPTKKGLEISWEDADKEIITTLKEISKKGGKIVLLSSTQISPSTRSVFGLFRKNYPGTEVVLYDASSASGMLRANRASFGKSAIPAYRFDKADIIVGFGADFLGTWLSPAEYTAQYTSGRGLDRDNPSMSKHYQFETGLSVTGSNADTRIKIKPSEERLILAGLYNLLARNSGETRYVAPDSPLPVGDLAQELLDNKGRSLIVSGSNDSAVQQIVNEINYLLGNYGSTIDFSQTLNLKQAISGDMIQLVEEMNEGKVQAVLCYNVNPAYDYPQSDRFISGLEKADLSLSFSFQPDETSALTDYVCPDNHFLESWNDANPGTGYYSLQQPVIQTLFNTRQVQDSLLKWSGAKRNTIVLSSPTGNIISISFNPCIATLQISGTMHFRTGSLKSEKPGKQPDIDHDGFKQ